LAAVGAARSGPGSWGLWQVRRRPDHGVDDRDPLVVDIDATLVTANSDKEQAAPNFQRGFGFHPLCAFVDHGPGGAGEPVAMLLRPGNAGANTAANHKTVLADALAQLPDVSGHRVRLAYSIGFGLTATMAARLALIPAAAWTPAYDSGGGIRAGARVAEATGVLDLSGWPAGMRVIVRKERPHPGAQLRFTDHDGLGPAPHRSPAPAPRLPAPT
jgi:hypothetical protein